MAESRFANEVTRRGFKGIAVFTPGGDLVYCRDYQKQTQWHLHLCAALQEYLELAEAPHFLVPCFTAAVDCWYEPGATAPHIAAEAYPLVYRYQGLLNAVFEIGNIEWQRILPRPEHRSVSVFDAYQSQFPQLWECHNLVLDVSINQQSATSMADRSAIPKQSDQASGHILRLFISDQAASTERILKTLQGVLESSWHPYTLQVVNVSKHPEKAEADQISATPTLLRVQPQPVRRLVGELSNPRAIVSLLSEP